MDEATGGRRDDDGGGISGRDAERSIVLVIMGCRALSDYPVLYTFFRDKW